MKRELLTQRRQNLKAGIPGRITVDQAFNQLTGANVDQDTDNNDVTSNVGPLNTDSIWDLLTGNESNAPTEQKTAAWWAVSGTVPAPKKGYWSVMLHVHGKKDEALTNAKSFYSGLGKTFRLTSVKPLGADEKPDPKRMIENLKKSKQ